MDTNLLNLEQYNIHTAKEKDYGSTSPMWLGNYYLVFMERVYKIPTLLGCEAKDSQQLKKNIKVSREPFIMHIT